MDDELRRLETEHRRAPDDPGAHLRLATAYGRAGRVEDAIDLVVPLMARGVEPGLVRDTALPLVRQLLFELDRRFGPVRARGGEPPFELAGPFDASSRTTWAVPGALTHTFATAPPTQLRCLSDDLDALRPAFRVVTLERVIFAFGRRPALGELSRLPHLRRLDLAGTTLVDDDLASLGGCPRLEELDLADTRTGDVGLRVLAACAELKRLRLAGCRRLTSRGVSDLGAVRRLEHLDLTGATRVTSTGLRTLADLEALTELLLEGTQVRDLAAFDRPGAFPRLVRLRLPRDLVARSAPALAARPELGWVAALARGDRSFERLRARRRGEP